MLFAPPAAFVSHVPPRPSLAPTASACTLVKAPQIGSLFSVASLSETDAMAAGVGSSGSIPIAIRWNGSSWSDAHAATNKDFGANTIQQVGAIPGSNGYWAVGLSHNSTGPIYTLIESWNGSQWSVDKRPEPGWLNAVAASSPSDAWAVGYVEGTKNPDKPLALHWNGTSWSRVTIPTPKKIGGAYLYAVADNGPDDAWAVGRYDSQNRQTLYTLAEHWDGTQWSVVSTPALGAMVSLTSVPNATTLWSSVLNPTANTFEEWNGSAWNIEPGDEGAIYSMVATTQNEVWAVGAGYNEQGRQLPLIERWSGSSWQTIASKNPDSHGNTFLDGAASDLTRGGVWIVGASAKGPFVETCS
jgi:hypothetical protein